MYAVMLYTVTLQKSTDIDNTHSVNKIRFNMHIFNCTNNHTLN